MSNFAYGELSWSNLWGSRTMNPSSDWKLRASSAFLLNWNWKFNEKPFSCVINVRHRIYSAIWTGDKPSLSAFPPFRIHVTSFHVISSNEAISHKNWIPFNWSEKIPKHMANTLFPRIVSKQHVRGSNERNWNCGLNIGNEMNWQECGILFYWNSSLRRHAIDIMPIFRWLVRLEKFTAFLLQ